MRNLFLFLTLLACLLSSCSSENPLIGENESKVILNISLDGVKPPSSRSENGGVNHLICLISSDQNLPNGSKVFSRTEVEAFTDGSSDYSLQLDLIPSLSYTAVLFACYDGAQTGGVYSVSDEGILTVDYDLMEVGNPNYDAFYGITFFDVSDNSNLGVILRRPFSQINIATDDLENESVLLVGQDRFKTQFKISSGVYSQLDMVTGTVKGELNPTEYFKESALYTGTSFSESGYKELQSNFILCGGRGEKGMVDASFTVLKSDVTGNTYSPVGTTNLSGLPVQANYRTNITGSFLTGENTITIGIDDKIGNYNNLEIEEGDYPDATVVSSPDEFITAMQSGGQVLVPGGTTINLALNSAQSPQDQSSPTAIVLEKDVNLIVNGELYLSKNSSNTKDSYFVPKSNFTITGNGIINVDGGMKLIDRQKGTTTSPVGKIDVNVSGITINSKLNSTSNTTLFDFRNDGCLTLENLKVNSSDRIIYCAENYENTEHLKIINSTLVQDNSSSTNSTIYLSIRDGSAEFDSTNVTSDVTCLNVPSNRTGNLLLNNCNFKLLKNVNDYYLIKNQTSNASFIITIQGGYYYNEGAPVSSLRGICGIEGNILITSGMFNVKPHGLNSTTLLSLPTGYEWVETGDTTYPFEVKAL